MPTLREVKKRIRSVINTRQITKAMEMVAAAKLRRAQMRIEQVRPYSEKLDDILHHLSAAASSELSHPYFEKREVKKRTLVLVTSDRGFCGSFNANLNRIAMKWLEGKDPETTELVCVGKKGFDFFKRREFKVAGKYIDWVANLNDDDMAKVRDVVSYLTDRFLEGETDEISVIYTQFLSMARYNITTTGYLPVERPETEDGAAGLDYIFEPSPEVIFADIMPKYTLTKMIRIMADSFASEQGTRMMAMNSATKNAGEMIDALTLQYNKARQAAITKELLEIVSGAEALKG